VELEVLPEVDDARVFESEEQRSDSQCADNVRRTRLTEPVREVRRENEDCPRQHEATEYLEYPCRVQVGVDVLVFLLDQRSVDTELGETLEDSQCEEPDTEDPELLGR